jgi:rhodanese-related sulfurtransferase
MAQEPTIRRPENLPEPVSQDQRIEVSEIDTTLADSNVVLLDVREGWELEKYGTRDGYIHIPLFELEDRLDELPRDKMILTA